MGRHKGRFLIRPTRYYAHLDDMRKRNTKGFHPRTGKNRAGFTKSDCSKGGSVCKGYETEEEHRQRQLIDAKGMVLKLGMSYDSEHLDGRPWQKRRALLGRTNQIEVLLDGEIVLTTGETKLHNHNRFLAEI